MIHISFVNLLFCGLLSTVLCYPAKTKHNDVNGQYYSEFGKIIISDNTFTYVIFQGNEHVYATDTLAKCELRWIDDKWGEINSQPSIIPAERDAVFENRYDDNLRDSIQVEISLSSSRSINVDLWSSCLGNKEFYQLEVRNGHGTITLNNVECGMPNLIYLCPADPPVDFLDNRFYGQAFETVSIPGNYRCDGNAANVISVNLPYIDDAFFERYIIKGEYIRFNKDTVIWRGRQFKKSSSSAQNRYF